MVNIVQASFISAQVKRSGRSQNSAVLRAAEQVRDGLDGGN